MIGSSPGLRAAGTLPYKALGEPDVYEFDNIVDMKVKVRAEYKYKIAWKGGSITWEPEQNLTVSSGGRRMRREFHSNNGISLYNLILSMDDIKKLEQIMPVKRK